MNMKMESRLGVYNRGMRTLCGLIFPFLLVQLSPGPPELRFFCDVLPVSLWRISERSVLVAITVLCNYGHWYQFCFQAFLSLAFPSCCLSPKNPIHPRGPQPALQPLQGASALMQEELMWANSFLFGSTSLLLQLQHLETSLASFSFFVITFSPCKY